ncbi:MAG: DUF4032 domain-containing protein [Acidimicrobiaceae bacterium]|nr:DUF4032 domain-containing protein [Acidimicrobiia bacterium]MCY4494330.1 DUF4032 domain-containing protein [Acidimicrobiaceae bacterium]
MTEPRITVRPGHPDFLDLAWEQSVVDWRSSRLVTLPKGISRHEVRFVAYDQGLYAVKELPLKAARNDYQVLRELERMEAPSVTAVGLVEDRSDDPGAERSAALITRYVDFSFSYRELLEGAGFGQRRRQMLAAFAGLLVELHLAGCFWGDCSLSNVLFKYDAMAIEALMVDAETAELHPELSDGQRLHDIDIMTINVAGGMADIAASRGVSLDDADTDLGEEMASWYEWLWDETTRETVIGSDERYRITERVRRLNDLGFTVDEVDLTSTDGGTRLRVRPSVGPRNHNSRRLREITGIEASEWQARHLLSDIYHFSAGQRVDNSGDMALAAIRWRTERWEPAVRRIRAEAGDDNVLQGYCDFLNYRYEASSRAGADLGQRVAFDGWLAAGRPGFRPEPEVSPTDTGI